MPQCPHCQAPYEAGQRYCSTCGSFLLHPEQGDTFCPQCGVRVSPRQEFCHECDAPLKEAQAAPEALGTAAGAAAPAPEAPPAKIPPSGMPSWLMGVLVGAGILLESSSPRSRAGPSPRRQLSPIFFPGALQW